MPMVLCKEVEEVEARASVLCVLPCPTVPLT